MRIYLIRHGETDLNARHCYYGVTEAELTEQGRQQASVLGKFFSEKEWDRVIVSPLNRTRETAQLVAGHMRERFEYEDSLKEQNFGIFEGMTYEEICEKYCSQMDAWNADFSDYRIPDGESFRDVRRRVESFVKSLPSGKGEILVVAHKGTLGHMLAILLGLPLEGYWNFVFDQGCYSLVDLEDGCSIIRKLNQSV